MKDCRVAWAGVSEKSRSASVNRTVRVPWNSWARKRTPTLSTSDSRDSGVAVELVSRPPEDSRFAALDKKAEAPQVPDTDDWGDADDWGPPPEKAKSPSADADGDDGWGRQPLQHSLSPSPLPLRYQNPRQTRTTGARLVIAEGQAPPPQKSTTLAPNEDDDWDAPDADKQSPAAKSTPADDKPASRAFAYAKHANDQVLHDAGKTKEVVRIAVVTVWDWTMVAARRKSASIATGRTTRASSSARLRKPQPHLKIGDVIFSVDRGDLTLLDGEEQAAAYLRNKLKDYIGGEITLRVRRCVAEDKQSGGLGGLAGLGGLKGSRRPGQALAGLAGNRRAEGLMESETAAGTIASRPTTNWGRSGTGGWCLDGSPAGLIAASMSGSTPGKGMARAPTTAAVASPRST